MARKYKPRAKVIGDDKRITEKQSLVESSPRFMAGGHELVKNILRHGRSGDPIPAHIIRNVLEHQFKQALRAARSNV